MKLQVTVFTLLLSIHAQESHAGDYQRHALIGKWKCGPMTMFGEGFQVNLTYTSNYEKDGRYHATSESTTRVTDGRKITMRDRSFGKWTLTNNIIRVDYDRVEFLYSDSPEWTIKMGQDNADAHQRKQSWSKWQIQTLDEALIKIPVQTIYEGARVQTTCIRIR